MLLGQIHGDLPRLRDLARPLRRVEPFGIEGQVAAYHLDDVFDRNLLLIELHVGFENLFGQRRGDLPSEERRVGHQRRQRAFDLAHVGRDVVGEELHDLFRDLRAHLLRLGADDLHLRVVVGLVELGGKPPLETRQQTVLDVLQFDGRLIRREDQLLARQVQVVEDVEEDVLRTRLSGQLLDVVDDEHVDHLIEVDEIGNFAAFVRRLELGLEFVHRHVEHLQLGMTLQHFVADRLCDVGLSQSRIAVYIQGVERRRAGIHRHRHAGRPRQPVALPLDEGREGVVRIELRVDSHPFEAGNDERIFYICRVVLRSEARDGRRIGFSVQFRRLGFGHGVVEPRLLAVELRDDRTQERDVVFLDLVDVAGVGHAQTQRRSVEFERDDGLEPFGELLGGGLLLDPVQAKLPYIAVCLRVIEHAPMRVFFV